MFSRARALQLNFWASCLVREGRDGVCSRRVQKILLSSPVVRKGGAREIGHQLSMRTEPHFLKQNVVKCPMRCRVNSKTRCAHPRKQVLNAIAKRHRT